MSSSRDRSPAVSFSSSRLPLKDTPADIFGALRTSMRFSSSDM